MKFTSALVALAACLAAVQSVNAECKAQAVFDTCIKNAKTELDKCGQQDFPCRCEKQKAVVQCYQQCPEDSALQGEAVGAQGLVTTYCVQVPSANPLATSTSIATPSNAASSAVGNSPAANPPAGTSTGSGANPTSNVTKPGNSAQSVTVGSFVVLAGLGVAAMNV